MGYLKSIYCLPRPSLHGGQGVMSIGSLIWSVLETRGLCEQYVELSRLKGLIYYKRGHGLYSWIEYTFNTCWSTHSPIFAEQNSRPVYIMVWTQVILIYLVFVVVVVVVDKTQVVSLRGEFTIIPMPWSHANTLFKLQVK